MANYDIDTRGLPQCILNYIDPVLHFLLVQRFYDESEYPFVHDVIGGLYIEMSEGDASTGGPHYNKYSYANLFDRIHCTGVIGTCLTTGNTIVANRSTIALELAKALIAFISTGERSCEIGDVSTEDSIEPRKMAILRAGGVCLTMPVTEELMDWLIRENITISDIS